MPTLSARRLRHPARLRRAPRRASFSPWVRGDDPRIDQLAGARSPHLQESIPPAQQRAPLAATPPPPLREPTPPTAPSAAILLRPRRSRQFRLTPTDGD